VSLQSVELGDFYGDYLDMTGNEVMSLSIGNEEGDEDEYKSDEFANHVSQFAHCSLTNSSEIVLNNEDPMPIDQLDNTIQETSYKKTVVQRTQQPIFPSFSEEALHFYKEEFPSQTLQRCVRKRRRFEDTECKKNQQKKRNISIPSKTENNQCFTDQEMKEIFNNALKGFFP